MPNLEFLDKRDLNNLFLHNSAYALSSQFVEDCMEIISKYEIYIELSSYYQKEYIEFYFRKLLFYSFLPIANQLVIDNWNKSNSISSGVTTIDVKNFPNIELLNKAYPASVNIKYVGILKSKLLFCSWNIKKIIKYVKQSIDLSIGKFLIFSTNFKNLSITNRKGKKISTHMLDSFEDVDLNKRSTIFWLQDNNINPSDVLVYFNLNRKKSEKLIERLNTHNVNWVNLRYWKNEQKTSPNYAILKSYKNISSFDSIHKWLLLEARTLVFNIDYWYSFFKTFNVTVHHDQTEHGQEVIVKQIALCKLNALSFSSQRSYLDNIVGRFYSYYPTDVFFSWGEDSSKRMQRKVIIKDNPAFKSILTTGCYMLDQYVVNQYKDVEYIKDKFNSYGVKKTILFLDTNHALCNALDGQTITTKDLESLYIAVFTVLIEHQEIGLIVKPKKSKFFNSLNITSITKQALDTGRLHIVTNPEGVKPSVYANISDITLSILNHDIPASLVECILSKKPGILYNYGGLNSVEPEFFSWAHNTVIFDTVVDVVSALKTFVLSQDSSLIGDWSSHILEFDPFLDFKAANRIGFYLSLLLKYSHEELEKDIIIDIVNDEYSREFGKDKVASIR